eukprot:TRINITY_DN4456_c0_g1_i1.p1 TRINITY_DN4456_c0_g1~~TRINITY_DN4456_c0_g1_i1.p1  ORF type:complete len:105 (-),score=13.23 TRINITY_DN4456_c0_g1_i1:92-406(-)
MTPHLAHFVPSLRVMLMCRFDVIPSGPKMEKSPLRASSHGHFEVYGFPTDTDNSAIRNASFNDCIHSTENAFAKGEFSSTHRWTFASSMVLKYLCPFHHKYETI